MAEICRAITFINHHIPYREYADLHFKYITLGFFDGMDTQLLHVDYKRDGLQALWRYVLERTAQNSGLYSFQNLFCFSDDAWNNCRDSEFWEEDTDRKYPLTFVSLLQLNEYSADKDGVRKKCMEYRNSVDDNYLSERQKIERRKQKELFKKILGRIKKKWAVDAVKTIIRRRTISVY